MYVKRKKKEIREFLNSKDMIVCLPEQIISKYLIKDKDLQKDDVIAYLIYGDATYEIVESFRELPKKDIYLYFNDLSYERIQKIKRFFKNIKNIAPFIDNLRTVKDEKEIENIKKACKITKKGFEIIDVDKSEIQIAKELKMFFIEKGDGFAFEPIIAYNKNTASRHHIPKNTNPHKKEIVMIDIGAKYKDYCADATRTYTQKYKQEHEDVYNALQTIEDIAREGTTTTELTKTATKVLKKYRDAVFHNFHLLGHGVGLEVHERPEFNKNTILKKNMVITLEPAIYIKNKFGIRIENTYIIRKNKKPKNLFN